MIKLEKCYKCNKNKKKEAFRILENGVDRMFTCINCDEKRKMKKKNEKKRLLNEKRRLSATKEKQCTECKLTKHSTDFYKSENTKSGFAPICKYCTSEARKKRYKLNEEKERERSAKYRAKAKKEEQEKIQKMKESVPEKRKKLEERKAAAQAEIDKHTSDTVPSMFGK